MVDVVYVLGRGSRWGNNEIRYSLRSIHKHLTNHGRVFIVGEYPAFLQNVIHIPAEDTKRKQFSIFQKILKAVNDERVSDRFIFFNDDHFLLKTIDVSEFKYWYDGTLEKRYHQYSGYYKTATGNTLKISPINALYYDIHAPIVYSKQTFIDEVAGADWSKEYIIKSLYMRNHSGENTEPMADLKINKRLSYDLIMGKLAGKTFFSIGDHGINPDMKRVFKELYPEPSIYEK